MSEGERAAIVTGGTGALGRAVVETFLASGHRVLVPWIVAREHEEASAHFREACAAGRLVLFEADLARDEGIAELARRAAGVGTLVNGVGGFAGGAPLHEAPLDDWDRMFRLNVRSTAAATRAVLPALLARGSGAVVNVASQAALDPPAGLGAYAASKAGVIALTRSLAREVAARGIRVNAVLPGTIDTPANRAAMPDADRSSWTPPERIAAVIHWLASDAALAVRGALIPV